MLLDMLGLAVMLAATFLVATLVAVGRLGPRLKALLLVGLALRVVGAIAYGEVISMSYGGGDYLMYLDRGLAYAERMRQFDFAMLTRQDEWLGGKWWGTQFVFVPIAIIAAMLGPSALMQFIAFGLLSFLGLLCFGLAFHRTHPEVPVANYLRWVLLFPALWFWPSAPGKEALIVLGAGLTVLGYCGRMGRIGWLSLGLGLLLVFAIRPQVAMVFLVTLMLAPWLGAEQGWSLRRVVQGIMLGGLAVVGSGIATRNLGIEDPSVAGVGAYLEARGKGSSKGSDVQTARVSWRGVPAALGNVWLRPFPWEARSPTALLSAVEIGGLWGVLLIRRRRIVQSLKDWRRDRLLRLAVPFLLLYSASAGMTMWNLGIIARQRILLFPFLFLLLEISSRRPIDEVRGRIWRRRQTAPEPAILAVG